MGEANGSVLARDQLLTCDPFMVSHHACTGYDSKITAVSPCLIFAAGPVNFAAIF